MDHTRVRIAGIGNSRFRVGTRVEDGAEAKDNTHEVDVLAGGGIMTSVVTLSQLAQRERGAHGRWLSERWLTYVHGTYIVTRGRPN